jgi:hypothetical protein
VRQLALEAVVAVLLEDRLTDEPVFDGRHHMQCFATRLQTTPPPLVLDTLVLLLEGLSSRNRSGAFVILAQLGPVLANLADADTLRRLADAIGEVQDWWP